MGCGLVAELYAEAEDDLVEGEKDHHHENLSEDKRMNTI